MFFDNVRVPVRNRIGQEGMGFIKQMQQFQEERLFGAASSRGRYGAHDPPDRRLYPRAQNFGRPMIDNQAIHFRLAEFRTEVELVRSLGYRACEKNRDGTEVTKLASMAKLKAGRILRLVTDGCLQYWGGAGYLWETPSVHARTATARLASIGGGADEIMLQIICKLMGTLPRLENR